MQSGRRLVQCVRHYRIIVAVAVWLSAVLGCPQFCVPPLPRPPPLAVYDERSYIQGVGARSADTFVARGVLSEGPAVRARWGVGWRTVPLQVVSLQMALQSWTLGAMDRILAQAKTTASICAWQRSAGERDPSQVIGAERP